LISRREALSRPSSRRKVTRAVTVSPTRKFNVGAGYGKSVIRKVKGGVVGLILDARCRPIQLPADQEDRVKLLQIWNKELDIYPEK